MLVGYLLIYIQWCPLFIVKELLGVLWTLPRSLLFWKHSCVRHSTEFSMQDLVLPALIALASVSQLLTVWLFFLLLLVSLAFGIMKVYYCNFYYCCVDSSSLSSLYIPLIVDVLFWWSLQNSQPILQVLFFCFCHCCFFPFLY